MKRKALLIGINKYQTLGKLSYARQDAEAFSDVLCKQYGFSSHDIHLMTCQAEGAAAAFSRYIELAISDLVGQKELDLLVFGFWGHGFAPEPGKRYLCGLDTIVDDLERTAVSMDVIRAKLSQVGADNTLLVLDCCQNKPTGRSVEAETLSSGEEAQLSSLARDIQAARREQSKLSIPTVALLNSCREGQRAYEWTQREHGIFTAHLLDQMAAGISSIAQLASSIFDPVSQTALNLHRQSQTPFVVIEGKGDIALKPSVGNLGVQHISKERPSNSVDNTQQLTQQKTVPQKPKIGLFEAVENNIKEEVFSNLECGADVNAKNTKDFSPLHIAVAKGHEEITVILLKKKANVNIKANGGLTPLHAAASKNRNKIVKLLIDYRANVNSKSDNEATPLDIALLNGNIQCAQVLLENGADPNMKTKDGITPLQIAIRQNKIEVVKLLLKHKANIKSKGTMGFTPLHASVGFGREEITKMLLEHGAEVNAKEEKGLTPLDFAKDDRIASILKKHGGRKGEACFLTTSICESLNKPDDCHELIVLRQFRDTFMQETGQRRAEVSEYYRIAPKIVDAVNAQPAADVLWGCLASKYILPCIKHIENNCPEKAYLLYGQMVHELKEQYLDTSTERN